MCQARFSNGSFDPALCPLLAGLSPDEIADRLANDPMIRACAGMDKDCRTASARRSMPCSSVARGPKSANPVQAYA